jgi:lipopolysaccharide transport system ATP-binding protein
MESIYRFRRRGGTLLVVSHDLGTIQSLCNRALWIEDGLVAAEGAPADVVMAYKQHMAALEEAQNDRMYREGLGDGQRWGTREVEITEVELCSGGQPRTTFNTGEPMTIRLHYRCAQPMEHPVFGFAINHQNGTHIFGPNTKFAALTIDRLSQSGVISYHIPELPLLEGQYVLSVAAVNDADTITYDYHDRAYNFRVAYSSLRAGYGMVQLHGSWQMDTTTQPALRQAINKPHSQWTKA